MDKITKDRIAEAEIGVGQNGNEVTIEQKNERTREIISKNFGKKIWAITDICLSTIATLLLEDIVNPTGLILIGSPSTEKTTVLSFFYGIRDITYKSDSFTPASFVSHSPNVPKKELPDIDLLPRIKHKCIIVPELAPIFQKRREDLVENISTLIRVFDGQGLETDSGARGKRGYTGDYLFSLLGASTPLDFRVWKILGKLGSRLLFLTVLDNDSHNRRIKRVLSGLRSQKAYKQKVEECKDAVHDCLTFLWRQHKRVRSVEWKRDQDEEKLMECIVKVANLVALARSVVTVWREKESDYNFNQPIIEGPFRLATILYNLARGHAIVQGRNKLSKEDVRLVIEVGLSSMPDDRRRVLNLLLGKEPDETVKTNEITERLSVSDPTARAIMETFRVLEIAKHEKAGMGISDSISLKEDFHWFLSKEFREFRGEPENKLTPCERQEQTYEEIPF